MCDPSGHSFYSVALPRALSRGCHVLQPRPFRLWPGASSSYWMETAGVGQSSPSLTKEESAPAPPASPRRSWSGRPLCRVRVASSCPLCISCCG